MAHLHSLHKGANKRHRYVPSRLFRDRLRLDRPPTPGLYSRVPSRGQAIPRQGRGFGRDNDVFGRTNAPRLPLHRDCFSGCGWCGCSCMAT